MNLNELLSKILNEREVEITSPTPADKWGLKITVNGKTTTFAETEPDWQAAIKEVIGWIRKNLNYDDFKTDNAPVDLQFKADGTVLISSDTGQIDFQGKQVPSVKYRLSTGLADKVAKLLGAQK
jgi:hypothetical protein